MQNLEQDSYFFIYFVTYLSKYVWLCRKNVEISMNICMLLSNYVLQLIYKYKTMMKITRYNTLYSSTQIPLDFINLKILIFRICNIKIVVHYLH